MQAMEDHGGSTREELLDEDKQDEMASKSLADSRKTNGVIDHGADPEPEVDLAMNSEDVSSDNKPFRIDYFCEPNQNKTKDAIRVFFYFMLPFTTVPHIIVALLIYWSYLRWGAVAVAFYVTLWAIVVFTPQLQTYNKEYRESVREAHYRLLATYVPSCQYIVPKKPFPENRPYIFACHPHGRMFYSTMIFSQLHETWRKGILKSGDLFMTAAGGFFYIPVINILFSLVGTIPASRSSIVSKLRENNHVTILVGGVKEVLLGTEDKVDHLYLKKRKGFCKIAIQEKAGVVPVYFFNENQMFRHNSKSFLKFWEVINRYYKIGVPFMRGRFLLLPMPYRRPLLLAVGEPLFAKEGESVDDFHQRYMQALQELFNKYVRYSPDPTHKLIIE